LSKALYETYKDALRRGHVAAMRGRLDAAIAAYSEAAAIAPDRPLPHASVGGILLRAGKPGEAADAYDRALALGPRDEVSLRGRAEAMIALGRPFDAAEALDRLADVLDAAGRLTDACDAARHALELAESKDRRRQVEALVGRLRGAAGDEAAEMTLARAVRLLELAPVDDSVAPGIQGADRAVDDASGPDGQLGAEADSSVEPEVEPEPEPEAIDAIEVGSAAEEALAAGDTVAARDGLLAAAVGHRASGRSAAAIDACNLALAIAPADVDLHLLLAELYLERGWRAPAADKLVLLARLASLADDGTTRDRICRLATEQLPDEARLADLCA
jgi:tetratricopeptide (TPR) repeat protein